MLPLQRMSSSEVDHTSGWCRKRLRAAAATCGSSPAQQKAGVPEAGSAKLQTMHHSSILYK
jgi:hypothetical protein